MTLSSNKKSGLINLRELFILFVVEDPTEGKFAEEVFGDHKAWKKILDTGWINDYVHEWREVADTKRKELAFRAIINEVKTGRTPFTAAKYLIEEPWKTNTRRVKDTKARTSSEAFKAVNSDIDRLREEGLLN